MRSRLEHEAGIICRWKPTILRQTSRISIYITRCERVLDALGITDDPDACLEEPRLFAVTPRSLVAQNKHGLKYGRGMLALRSSGLIGSPIPRPRPLVAEIV